MSGSVDAKQWITRSRCCCAHQDDRSSHDGAAHRLWRHKRGGETSHTRTVLVRADGLALGNKACEANGSQSEVFCFFVQISDIFGYLFGLTYCLTNRTTKSSEEKTFDNFVFYKQREYSRLAISISAHTWIIDRTEKSTFNKEFKIHHVFSKAFQNGANRNLNKWCCVLWRTANWKDWREKCLLSLNLYKKAKRMMLVVANVGKERSVLDGHWWLH